MRETVSDEMLGPFTVSIPKPPDYMDFVDSDIRVMFDGRGGYLSHEPLLAQLIKEIRLMREVLIPQTQVQP